MSWKQTGFSIFPISGREKAPTVNVKYFDNLNKTAFIVHFDGEMVFKDVEKTARRLYDAGKEFYKESRQ